MSQRLWIPSRRQWLRAGAVAALGGAGAVLSACGGGKPAAATGGGSGTAASTSAPAAASGSASASGAAIGVNGMTITIRQAPGKVTLTGAYDSSWQGIPAINIDPSDPGVSDRGATAQNPSFTDKVYMQYDSTNLYVLEVRTQSPPFQANGGAGQFYLGDTFMMFFDTDKDASGTAYIDGDYAFFITPFNGTSTAPRAWDREGHSAGGANEHDISGDVKMGYKTTAAGYNFAIAMPWKEIQVTVPWAVKKGASTGFCLGAASQTADGTWGQMQFNGKDDDQSTWGTLVLA